MKLKSVLFPTDFSTYNVEALDYASCLAAESGAQLHIVHVHDSRDLTAAAGEAAVLYTEQWAEMRRLAEEDLKKLVPSVSTVPYEHKSLIGLPDAEIVNYAKDNHIDLIVMASHGRSGISRLLIGSVAEAVMRKAPCPVLIVKQPHAESVNKAAE